MNLLTGGGITMGKAQDRVEEIDKEIEELTKERELAIQQAKDEKIVELKSEKVDLGKEINKLDSEWEELKKSLDGKDRRFNNKKSRLVEVEAELESLMN